MKSNVNYGPVRNSSLAQWLGSSVRRHLDFWIATVLFVLALALYVRTMPPTVLDGDSGEYQYMAYILGVPHSTGYPLYILLGKLFTFLPVGDVAYRINLFSAVFAALVAPLVYWTARRLVPNRIPAFLATLILIVTPSMWGSAIEAKTYALHLFLGVLTIFLALRWYQEGKTSDFWKLALVCGLGLTNHPIYRFMAPGLLVALWFNRSRLSLSILARGVLIGLIPLLLYAYIPIRANQLIAMQDPANKALYGREDAMLKGTITAYYNNTPEGLFKLITGLDNSYKWDVKSPLDSANRIDLSTNLLLQQFGIIGVALALVGAWVSWSRDRRVFLILFGVAACNGIAAFYLRGISTVFYFSLTYLVLALWIGIGIDGLMQWLRRVSAAAPLRAFRAVGSPLFIVPLILVVPVTGLLGNFAAMDESANYAPRDYALEILKENIPQNSVVVAPWEISQPLRYFQFVENRRPDLLVINLSPVGMSAKQFDTVLANANKLNRPLYLVEFKPESMSATGPRSVQAIPLPMRAAPKPQHPLQTARIIDNVQVLGYDLDPDPPQPGEPTRIWIYYRALGRMYPMYSAMLSVGDVLGRPWGDYYGFPVSYNFPTYRWYELGEYYRDGWMVYLPPDAPNGLYNLDLSWYVHSLDTGKSDYDHENKLALGTIRVGSLASGQIARPGSAKFGQDLEFLGWSSNPASAGKSMTATRGQSIDLDLFWRAERGLESSYTVFVHLVDSNGRVVADSDSPPLTGMYPTNRWVAGETVNDRHTLKLPQDLAPGGYAIEIGMYTPATGDRLSIAEASEQVDKLTLTQLEIK